MEGMKDVKSDGSLSDETEQGVVYIDLPVMTTMLLDLSALKVWPTLELKCNGKAKFLLRKFWMTLCLGHP